MEKIIDQLISPNAEDRSSVLSQILNSVSSTGTLLVPNPLKLMSTLGERLLDEEDDRCLELLQELVLVSISTFGPDLEGHFCIVLPSVVSRLQDTRPGVAKKSSGIIKAYVKRTGNLENVFSALVKSGLQAAEWRQRHQSLQCIVSLLQSYPSYTSNLAEMKSLRESVESLTQDQSLLVAELAQDFSRKLNEMNLSSKRIPKEPALPPLKKVPAKPLLSQKQIEISPDLLSMLTDENWQIKTNAISELERQLSFLDSYSSMNTVWLFNTIKDLLENTHFKVMQSAINLLNTALVVPGLPSPSALVVVPVCIQKLGDNKISIRQAIFKAFKAMIKILPIRCICPFLVEGCSHSNWHIREESTNIFTTCMLLSSSGTDFVSYIPVLAKLLDDPKTKVRFVATESLAVCFYKCGRQATLEVLRPIVDSDALVSLQNRFKTHGLPVVRDSYLEFPKIYQTYGHISSPYLTTSSFASTSVKTPIPPRKQSSLITSASMTRPEIKKVFPKNVCSRLLKKPPREDTGNLQLLSIKHEENRPVQTSPSIRKKFHQYLEIDDLQPLQDPEDAMQQCLENTSDWSNQFEVLNKIRSLLKFHAQLFSAKSIHAILQNVCEWADSLRSSLAKNSIIVIGEMSRTLGKSIDNDLAQLIVILMKRAADTNNFIAKEAVRSLEMICKKSSKHKLTSVLMKASSHKSPVVKTNIANCFCVILNKSKDPFKINGIEKVVQALANYMTDAASNVRQAARKALKVLYNKNQYKLQNILKQFTRNPEKFKEMLGFTDENTKLRTSQANFYSWKDRYNIVSQFSVSLMKNIGHLDRFVTYFQDESVKVQKHALVSFVKLVPVLNNKLDGHLNKLVKSLVPCFNSPNDSIKKLAIELVEQLVESCDLLEALCVSIIEVKPPALGELRGILKNCISKAHSKNPTLLLKFALPAALQLMEIEENSDELLTELHRCIGSKLIDQVPPSKIHQIINILRI